MLHCSGDMVRDRCNYFSFWAIFCPFTPLTAQKIKILKKWKKHLEISSFYTSVPKIMIICYTVPEIWCMTDVITFHFGPFLALFPANSPKNQNLKKKWKKSWRYHCFTIVYQKLWSYAMLFVRYGTWQMWLLFFILDYFLSFYSPKKQNFKKIKKIPEGIILHKSTKNHDHMLYCSWDMTRDRWNCYF